MGRVGIFHADGPTDGWTHMTHTRLRTCTPVHAHRRACTHTHPATESSQSKKRRSADAVHAAQRRCAGAHARMRGQGRPDATLHGTGHVRHAAAPAKLLTGSRVLKLFIARLVIETGDDAIGTAAGAAEVSSFARPGGAIRAAASSAFAGSGSCSGHGGCDSRAKSALICT